MQRILAAGLMGAAFFASVFLVSDSNAQSVKKSTSNEVPQTVMVLVRSSAIRSIRNAFDSIRSGLPAGRVTAMTLAWKDSKAISAALGIGKISPVSLKPYISNHNAALEDLREHMNPQLFTSQAIAGSISQSINANLSAAESKLARWFVLTYADSLSPDAAAAIVKRSGLIETAEPKYRRLPTFTPNDPLFSEQYGPQWIEAPQAWDIVQCDSTIVTGDVDVGTDWTHPDLANAIYLNQGEMGLDSNHLDKRSNGIDDDGNGFVDDWHGWDFTGSDGNSPDNDPKNYATYSDAVHGTHTAGILAASGNNGIGIAGVAFGAKIVPVKCTAEGDPAAYLYFGFEGITYACDMGAKVVNCSWGGTSFSQSEQDVINYVSAKGTTVCAAAGNDNMFEIFYPASYAHVFSVGAIQQQDTAFAGDSTGQASYIEYSNHSPFVSVCAPGSGVVSTIPNGSYEPLSGTSMATPHAAGSLALVLKRFPSFTADQSAQQVRVTCDPIPSNPFPDYTGKGKINLYRAVTETNTYSVRIDSVEIIPDNGLAVLQSGSGGNIILHVKNYLKPIKNLVANVQFLGASNVVSNAPSNITFGAAATLETVKNALGSFHITIPPNAPDTSIYVRVIFSDASVGYTSDEDYFGLAVNPPYALDLDSNHLKATFDSRGAIGYAYGNGNIVGDGFTWQVLPPSVLPTYSNVLYASGLMVGLNPRQVVSHAPGTISGSSDTDFTAERQIYQATEPDHTNASQELVSSYSDLNADSAAQVGVSVTERVYAFDEGLSSNAAVIDYDLRKRMNASGGYPTDSAAISLYADWDIGTDGQNNVAAFDSLTNTAIFFRIDPNYPWVGTTLLSRLPGRAAVQYYADLNDGSDGSVYAYGGLAASDKWTMMTDTTRHHAGPGDVSMAYGLRNVPLFSADSIQMTLAIALATDRTSLLNTLQDTRKAWFETESVGSTSTTFEKGLVVFPTPFANVLHVRGQAGSFSTPSEVTLYDLLGRAIKKQITTSTSLDLETSHLAPGVYRIEVVQGSLRFSKPILCVR